jgi:hypothetical protein
MVRVEHELEAPTFVFAVQFRIPVIVANQGAAPDALDREDAEVVSWTVVGQITDRSRPVSCAEHLVVAVYELAAIVDDVEAVVRLVLSCKPVRRPEDDPDVKLTCQIEYPLRAFLEQGPIEALMGREIDSRVTRETSLREMRDVCASIFGGPDLARNVPEVPANIGVNRELAGRNC